ncbi:MAG: hemolysin III family protein [Oscillospiraceae bacterium]|nr:hemolysin III family protein [Oscillospiraceae bacterium]
MTQARTPLRERVLPRYSRGEELMNMITHIVGASVGVLILVFGVLIGASHRDPWAIVSAGIYGFATISLFTVSSVYHGLNDGMAKRVMQVIDHCTIYFLIAGTYTPILLAGIREMNPAIAWVVFGVEWGCACTAAVFTAIDLKKYAKLSMICYLAMGWAVVAVLKPTITVLTMVGFWWLLGGGICYTVGAVLYGIGKKRPYFHSIFHMFVNAGSFLQAIAILCYVL